MNLSTTKEKRFWSNKTSKEIKTAINISIVTLPLCSKIIIIKYFFLFYSTTGLLCFFTDLL